MMPIVFAIEQISELPPTRYLSLILVPITNYSKSGTLILLPLFMADSCAQIPAHV